MKIVWAAAYGGVHRGGFIAALEAVARRLLARGDALEVVAPAVGPAGWHDDVRALGVGLHVVPDRPAAAARAVARLRGDLVHAHFHDWLNAVTVAVWPSRARLLWHLHSTFETTGVPVRPTPLRLLKYRVLGARVERFVCVTETIAREGNILGVPERKLVVVRNAVDASRYRPPAPAERAEARARLALGEGPAVAFFGRDPAIKGADVLAAALERLPGITVVAVATPPDALEALGRNARVVAVPFTDDVRGLLWAADALAVPSRGEGMPFVALEALASGVPVVTSDLPWALELARDQAGIRLARSEDPAALAEGLRAALAAPRPAEPAGVAGAGLDGWAERILALYDSPRLAG